MINFNWDFIFHSTGISPAIIQQFRDVYFWPWDLILPKGKSIHYQKEFPGLLYFIKESLGMKEIEDHMNGY